jgi:hypothetical protein
MPAPPTLNDQMGEEGRNTPPERRERPRHVCERRTYLLNPEVKIATEMQGLTINPAQSESEKP